MKKDSVVSQIPRWVWWFVTIFLIVITGILYINLGRDTLFDWDEGIYATLGAHAVKTNALFVSEWNGSTWFEKPPGIAWLSGLGQQIGGHTAGGSRLFQPIVTAGVLYSIFLIGSSLASWPAGLASMGLLATFNLFLGRSRAVNVDMPLLLGISTTVYLLLKKKEPWKVALAIALSIWFKGVAGVLSIILAAPLFLSKPREYSMKVAGWVCVLVLPWHLYAYWRFGEEFLTPYIREQVFARITTPIEFHTESRWFYFTYLYNNLGLGVVLVSCCGGIASLYRAYKNKTIIHVVPLWWALVPLVIFTVAKTRLFWYILPVYPAIALLVGIVLTELSARSKKDLALIIIAGAICLQGLLVSWRSVEPDKKTAIVPDRIQIVTALSEENTEDLLVLVPQGERTAEAILPMDQRISSSFRYGGMPSVVYYYGGHVLFYYNVDEFVNAWVADPAARAMIAKSDMSSLPAGYSVIMEKGEYLAVQKGVYAER